ncbi:MAG: trypsin-like peptidase domain-containing protein [Gloeobacteraceae cyanobacterium ES-bin-144]|nr:trypsin-like peptidase domain-containing protein [Verrucomicrobiales bacterium]
MNPSLRRLLALIAVFIAAFVAVVAVRTCRAGGSLKDLAPWFSKSVGNFRPEKFSLPEKSSLNLGDVQLLARMNDEYASLTQAVVPSVVSIDTAGIKTERISDPWSGSHLRRYPTQGQGSGVIVTKEGHVMTNHHVIAGQSRIQVTLHDGKTHSANLIGEDVLLDIAVLKIEGGGTFTPLMLGDSSQVQVGQMVFAVGNPFGLGETITQGIISAKERSLSDNQRDLFQTDAAINPGNSGGPLVNIRGEIIGINVAIFSQDKENPGFRGVGFSIPSNDVKDTLFQILERGRPIRGYLGVQMCDLNPAIVSTLKYDGTIGSMVQIIAPSSPAQAAGLQALDIVQSFNGEPIRSSSQLLALVQSTKIGTTPTLVVWRKGQTIDIKPTIAESGQTPVPAKLPENATHQGRTRDPEEILNAIGIQTRDISIVERMNGARGAVVTGVTANGLAAGVIRPGDLIYSINNFGIVSAREFSQHLAASAAVQDTSLVIVRNRQSIRITLPAIPRKE